MTQKVTRSEVVIVDLPSLTFTTQIAPGVGEPACTSLDTSAAISECELGKIAADLETEIESARMEARE